MDEPIKVLHVVTHMNRGGLESMIMNYYRNIDRSKVQFDFLTHRPEEEKKDFDEEICSLGGKIYHIHKLNPFSYAYHKELDHFFKSHPEYRIIHVHQDCMSSVILKVAKKNGVSIRIAHSHSSNQDRGIKYYIKKYYKKNIKKYATQMFACGGEAGKWMFETDKFEILPNAIDCSKYTFNPHIRNRVRDELGLDKNLVIGHVGRFCEVKNHKFIIEILEQIRKQRKDVKVLFAGQGELFENIQRMVEKKGLCDNVIFLGLRTDIPDILQAMDIFLLPSLYEGVPVSIIEAQAAGLKCFISNTVPIDCAITDLVTTIPLSESPDMWAKAIVNSYPYDRKNQDKAIKDSRYDIVSNAKYLEGFYINKYHNSLH